MSRRSLLDRSIIEEPMINLTPLIDVVFVILIMFIIVAPLLEMDEIELAKSSSQPKEKDVAIKDASPITLKVAQDNTIRLNDQKITQQQLVPFLTKLKQQYPGVTPQILHDKRAHFGTYQGIKNALEEAGYGEMDVVLAPG